MAEFERKNNAYLVPPIDMSESQEDSLNIVEDYGEFLTEYENTTKDCFNTTKKVIGDLQKNFRRDEQGIWEGFTKNLSRSQKCKLN